MSVPFRPAPSVTAATALALVLVIVLGASPVGAVAEPADLELAPGHGTVEIRWPESAGDGPIRVLRDEEVIAEVVDGATSHIDRGLVPGTLHRYRVEAGSVDAPFPLGGEVGTAAVDLEPPEPVDHLVPIVVSGGVGLNYHDVLTEQEATAAERAGAEYRFYVDGELAGVHVGLHSSGQFTIGGLVNGVARYVEVEVIDRVGNLSLRRGARLIPLDLELPAAPVNLHVRSCERNSVLLGWDVLGGAAGDAGVVFEVRRDGEVVATTEELSARITGLVTGVPATFDVVALDGPVGAQPNRSPSSYEIDVTATGLGGKAADLGGCQVETPPLPAPPPSPYLGPNGVAPARLPAEGAVVNVLPTGAADYAGYRLFADGQLVRTGAVRSGMIAVPFGDVGTADRPVPVRLSAELVDTHGQASPRRNLTMVAANLIAPPAPGGLGVQPRDDGSVELVWDAVEGAAGYQIELDGHLHATVTGTAHRVASPSPRVATVTVRAVDGDGGRSLPTPPLLVVLG